MEGPEPSQSFVIELGDKWIILSQKYIKTHGTVYYRDENLIRIQPIGAPDRLYDFPLVDNRFDPELGVTKYYEDEKARFDGFIEQHDLRKGQFVSTFTADGEPAGNYVIDMIDPDADEAVFVDETGQPIPVEFHGIGIPLDLPFAVIFTSSEKPVPAEIEETDALETQATEESEADITVPSDAVIASLPVAEPDVDGGLVEGSAQVPDEEEFDIQVTGTVAVPIVERVQVLARSQRIYPDAVQKADALQDFTTLLKVEDQQNLGKLRKIRALTEMSFDLKQEIVKYRADGVPEKTPRPTSAKTLRELIKMTNIPLGRPVLDVDQRIYTMTHSDDTGELSGFMLRNSNDDKIVVNPVSPLMRDTVEKAYAEARAAGLSDEEVEIAVAAAAAKVETVEPNVEGETLDDPIHQVDMRLELAKIKGFMAPAATGTVALQFWIQIQAYMEQFGRPWIPGPIEGDVNENGWTAMGDTEFFRSRIPDMEKRTVRGIRPETTRDPTILWIDKVHFSLRRALGITYYSSKDKKRHVLFSPEVAPIESFMLFPYKYAYALGTSRSGYLFQDMINSQAKTTYMARILRLLKGVNPDEARNDSIVVVGKDGNSMGTFDMGTYIKGLPLNLMGTADAARELRHLGYASLEWDEVLGETIKGMIADYVNQVRGYIAGLRKDLEQAGVPTSPKVNELWTKEEMAWLFGDALASEPLLAAAVAEFTKQSPAAASSDYAMISYLIVKHYDYFLAAAGQNAVQIARERLKTTRANFLTALRNAVKIRDAIKGLAPEPNKCEHVARLRDIRRLPEQADRYKHLVKFLVRFQGQRNGNYVECSVCNRDLLCVHELLELKSFMNPREKEPLRKELLLNFCGPVSGNTYQCRNCGQSLGEIDFDNNMEFDDEGRPMTGYAVLEETEQKKIDEIDKALGLQENATPTELDFGAESRNFIYRVLRDIADRISVYPTKMDYDVMIGQVQGVISDLGDRDTFIAQQTEMAAQAGKKVKLTDYDLVLNRSMVAAAGAYMLIHVQTKIPEYMPASNLSGCKNPGFRGIPLEEGEAVQGLEYISCAIGSIMRNTAPWNMTGFQKEISDEKRLRNIFKFVYASIQDALDKPDVQLAIAAKRKYRQEIYGDLGGVKDTVSPFFLPPQRLISGAQASATGTVVNADVKGDATGPRRADVWIQAGNQIAAKVAAERGEIVVGTPFSEATCCYGPLAEPMTFWRAVAGQLPPLPARELRPGATASRALVRFKPRAQSEMLVAPPENLYYILFLNVCYQGPRYGLPHEPGLTHKCPHCEFQFPGSVQLMDVEKEGKAALEAQNVEVNRETFTALLDKTHQQYSVPGFIQPKLKDSFTNLRTAAEMNPAPMDGWAALVEGLIAELQGLPPDATVAMIQSKLGPLSVVGESAIGALQARFTKTATENLVRFANEPVATLGELCLAYFVVPFNRLITQLDVLSLETLNIELANELSTEHIRMLRENVFQPNTIVQKNYSARVKKATFVQAKLKYCVDQLRQVPPLLKKLMPTNVPGGERTLRYLTQALIFAPLATLMDPNSLPPNSPYQEAGESLVENSLRLIYEILAETLRRFRAESLSYSDEQLRDLIQIRAEKEKINIIGKFDRMSEDEKRVELMKKQLGMGDWAVGGTNKIIRYNADFFDIESEQRRQAGILDFIPGAYDPDVEAVPQGRPHSATGIYNFGEDGGEAANAYDMAPMAEEDF